MPHPPIRVAVARTTRPCASASPNNSPTSPLFRPALSGYLLKDAGAGAIVQDVAMGGAPTSPLVARKLFGYVRQHEASIQAAPSVRLTPRETKVLDQLVEDTPEVAIAEALGVSPHTVRTHVKNLYAKLEVHSRAQAVRAAYERGLV